MSKIFLSHSSAQKYIVEKIADKLGRDRVVYDKYTFETGMDTLDEIVKHLNNTDLFVVFLSEEALNSNWVKTELAQANRLSLLNSIKQFLPIIIDKSIDHNDPRIPEWIRKRTLRQIFEPFLIKKKIEQTYRDVLIDSNPLIKSKEELFVGRNDIMEEFESQVLTTSTTRPVSFICSGIEGVGRRTFMKKALAKTRFFNETYEPVSIYLDSKESIEDFIIKIEDINGSLSDDILESLKNKGFNEKIEQAITLVKKLIDNNEKLFVLDSGCIIQPNMQITPWFLDITNDDRLDNTLSIVLITRFRPNPTFILKNRRIKAIHVDALSEKDVRKLFVQYRDILGLTIEPENSEKILENLNGIPSQVHFSLDLIKATNVSYVLGHLTEIIEYGDAKVFYLMDEIQKDQSKLEILVLIAKVDFISFDLLYQIIGKTKKNEKILEDFFILGIYDTFGGFSDHLRVNYSVADYIRRSKFIIPQIYQTKLRQLLKTYFTDHKSHIDASELLLNVKNALIAGYKVPDRYFLPSFVLKSIVDMYYQGSYSHVVKLADKILENKSNMDSGMNREIRYWLCLALAREKDPRFEKEVKYIDGADFDFLYGFFYRRKRDFDKAISSFKKALDKSPNFNRAKRELVNVLLSKGQYTEALDVARQNYNNAKANAFHIQAYFICLIRKLPIGPSESKTLKYLLESIKKTNDRKADELYGTMMGEFEFYVNKDVPRAIQVLTESLKNSQYKYYPFKALLELYIKQGQYSSAEALKAKYDKDHYAIEEVLTL
jgi:tetratricopeptide (TPR) repeat protein